MTFAMVSVEYLAGFIDGEGYLALGRIPRGGSTEYPVRMVVYNTNLEVIEAIRSVWGGTVSCSKSRKPGWKDQYALIWTNAAAARLLQRLLPHLIIKENHAIALLEFQEHVRRCKRARDTSGRLLPLSKRELGIREAFFSHLKRLNTRGSAVRMRVASREACRPRSREPSSMYLAGFIDAEGSLMITKSSSSTDARAHYRARISVANTKRVVLESIQRAYGGILVMQPSREPRWNHAYPLVWTGGMAGEILAAVMPYLRIKQEQAEILQDFLRHQRGTRQGRTAGGFAPLPDGVIAFRDALCNRVRKLNARGPTPAPSPIRREAGTSNRLPQSSPGSRR